MLVVQRRLLLSGAKCPSWLIFSMECLWILRDALQRLNHQVSVKCMSPSTFCKKSGFYSETRSTFIIINIDNLNHVDSTVYKRQPQHADQDTLLPIQKMVKISHLEIL